MFVFVYAHSLSTIISHVFCNIGVFTAGQSASTLIRAMFPTLHHLDLIVLKKEPHPAMRLHPCLCFVSFILCIVDDRVYCFWLFLCFHRVLAIQEGRG